MPTSFALSPWLKNSFQQQIESGRYNNVCEVIRTGLCALEEREQQWSMEALRLKTPQGVTAVELNQPKKYASGCREIPRHVTWDNQG